MMNSDERADSKSFDFEQLTNLQHALMNNAGELNGSIPLDLGEALVIIVNTSCINVIHALSSP